MSDLAGVGPALSALIEQIADEVQQRGRKHASGEPLYFDRRNLEEAIRAALSGSVGGLNAAPPASELDEHPPIHADEHGDWKAANAGARYYALRDAVTMYAGDGIISDDAVISMATEQAHAFNGEPTVDRLQRLRQAMLNDAKTFREFDGNDIRSNIALAYAARVSEILPLPASPVSSGEGE